MRISYKLPIAVFSGIFLISSVAFIGANSIESNLTRIVETEAQKIEAALEMEINLNESAAHLFNYLTHTKPQILENYQGDMEDLKYYLGVYETHVVSELGLSTYERLSVLIADFEKTTEHLLALKRNQTRAIVEQSAELNREIETMLDDDLQAGLNENDPQFAAKKAALMEMEINLLEIVAATRGYLLQSDEARQGKLADSISDLVLWREEYRRLINTEAERRDFAALENAFDLSIHIDEEVVDLEEQRRSAVLAIERLMEEIDAVFDEDVKALAEMEIRDAKSQMADAIWLLKLTIAIAAIISIVTVVLVVSPILRRIKELSEAIRKIGKATTARVTVDVTSSDEIGVLGAAFNDMSNTIVEKTNTLQLVNAELQEQIGRRMEALTEREKAYAANAAKSEFLALMNHELRTPLNAVLGFAQLLRIKQDEPLSEKQDNYVQQILKAGNHLLTLINEVLDLSQLEAGKLKIKIDDVNLSRVFKECEAMMAPVAQTANIRLHFQDITDGTAIRADYTRVKQVLINLVSNAIKYNQRDGEVYVSFLQRDDETVRISVLDNGPGISEERQVDLFKPFSRLGFENTNIEGSGIGLSFSQNIVELMDGEIGVDSEYGRGSLFWIDLPAAVEEVNEQDTSVAFFSASKLPVLDAPCKVLCIDDNQNNLALMAEILATLGNVEVGVSHSGRVGLEMMRKIDFDVVFVDINMPEMDGYEVLAAIQGDPMLSKVPVVAVTAMSSRDEREKGLKAGFFAFISKPMAADELTETLKLALEVDYDFENSSNVVSLV